MLLVNDPPQQERDGQPMVLIIDDELTTRLLVGECLRGDGFDVREVEDGNQGVEAFAEIRPSIVLMDVMMPGLDGFHACEAIRRMPEGQHTPILMMTGLDEVESIEKAYEVGATDFISKPFNYIILAHRVRYLLRASLLTAALHKSERRLAKAQRIAKLGNWEWDLVRSQLHLSDEIGRMFHVDAGTRESGAMVSQFLERVHPEERDFVEEKLRATLDQHQPLDVKHRVILPDGAVRTVAQQAEVTLDERGLATLLTGTTQDVTEREEAQEKIRYLAYHDSLTGLPNRESFKDCVQQALELASRGNRKAAILFLDLDNFKTINDTLSHRVGDLLLEKVAELIVNELRTCDRVMRGGAPTPSRVARLGGDEFTILLSEIHSVEDAATVARRILGILAKPIMVAGHEVFTTASLGISVYPHDGEEVDRLLMSADTAMYCAKGEGKNTHRFYSESMNARALERLALESNLRKAIDRRQFVLHYQPQVDLRSNKIVGMEALLRWEHPEFGRIPPLDFIPLAEESGLIVSIGEWVMETACIQNQRWQAAGLAPIHMAVNVSSVQFQQPQFIDTVRQVLDRTRLEPRWLELELTESVVLEGGKETIDKLKELREMGIRLAIDDFGTGYCSLNYLKNFPFTSLKMDQAFVRDLKMEGSDAAIAMGIIFIGHGLGLDVVAEGVESNEQLQFLRANHCDLGQGYYFSRPQPNQEIIKFLKGPQPSDPERPFAT